MIWRAGHHTFVFPRPALIMGVLNVTPDSFSDGGLFLDPAAAVARGRELARQGADIIDIGGESTRPQAAPVSEEEELRRVLPVLKKLAPEIPAAISIDTQKPGVARAALQHGASIVNDVGANRSDAGMWRVAARAGAGYVAMHMQGAPQTMHLKPEYKNVVEEVNDFFAQLLPQLAAAGIACEQVVLDVGIGFGKTLEHNLELLGALKRFTKFARPVLLAVSRKSFMGKLLGAELHGRLPAALACATLAIEMGVQIIRTHDVAETRQALRMAEAILAHKE